MLSSFGPGAAAIYCLPRALAIDRPIGKAPRLSLETSRVGMSVDQATVRRIAHLARIKVPKSEVASLEGELNAILAFVETLSEVDVAGVEAMTSVMPMPMKRRADIVDDGGIADLVTANAPASEDHFFTVPKVIE